MIILVVIFILWLASVVYVIWECTHCVEGEEIPYVGFREKKND
jgi:hypothetical protein